MTDDEETFVNSKDRRMFEFSLEIQTLMRLQGNMCARESLKMGKIPEETLLWQNVITSKHKAFYKLIRMIDSGEIGYKIGFDSCTVPAFVNFSHNINMDSLDICEGARWSAYISPDMKKMPCSFDNQDTRWAVNLRNHTIEEAWRSNEFEDFWIHFRNSCPDCSMRVSCMGGCPIRPEIVICDKKYNLSAI